VKEYYCASAGGPGFGGATVGVGGRSVAQTAIAWDPIGRLLEPDARAG